MWRQWELDSARLPWKQAPQASADSWAGAGPRGGRGEENEYEGCLCTHTYTQIHSWKSGICGVLPLMRKQSECLSAWVVLTPPIGSWEEEFSAALLFWPENQENKPALHCCCGCCCLSWLGLLYISNLLLLLSAVCLGWRISNETQIQINPGKESHFARLEICVCFLFPFNIKKTTLFLCTEVLNGVFTLYLQSGIYVSAVVPFGNNLIFSKTYFFLFFQGSIKRVSSGGVTCSETRSRQVRTGVLEHRCTQEH